MRKKKFLSGIKKRVFIARIKRNERFRVGRNNKKSTAQGKNYVSKFSRKNTKLIVPENFNTNEHIEKSLELLQKLRSAVITGRLKHLNFDKIKVIDISSALMLAAEVDVWNIEANDSLNSNSKNWNDNIKDLLCEIGFFELLKLPLLHHSQNNNITFLKLISGTKSEGDKAKKLRLEIERVMGKELENKIHLFEGLTEAFTNTRQHAYDSDKEINKWWITAAYDKSTKQLIVSMYDRGNSIPATMKTGKKWIILDERKNTSHNKLIEIAVKSSHKGKEHRSKTGQEYRGKGLNQFLSFIENCGELKIISGKGLVSFSLNNNILKIINSKELKYALQGTLVEWNIDLNDDV